MKTIINTKKLLVFLILLAHFSSYASEKMCTLSIKNLSHYAYSKSSSGKKILKNLQSILAPKGWILTEKKADYIIKDLIKNTTHPVRYQIPSLYVTSYEINREVINTRFFCIDKMNLNLDLNIYEKQFLGFDKKVETVVIDKEVNANSLNAYHPKSSERERLNLKSNCITYMGRYFDTNVDDILYGNKSYFNERYSSFSYFKESLLVNILNEIPRCSDL